MVKYKKFNIICLALCVFFTLGNIWIWRNEIARQKLEKLTNAEILTEKETTRLRPSGFGGQGEISEEVLTTTTAATTTEVESASATSSAETTEVKKDAADEEKPLPEKFNIEMSFTSQAPEKNWEQPWQDFCEEAAVLMMDAYYKKYNLSPLFSKDELLRIWEWEQNKNFGKSIEIKKIQEILSSYFELKSKIIENPTVEQIKSFIASGKPVLVVADGKVLPNQYFRNGGPVYHALIIHGYDETKFITHDPGSGWSKNYEYEYNVLLNSIHDWNNGDVPNGRKVILVVE